MPTLTTQLSPRGHRRSELARAPNISFRFMRATSRNRTGASELTRSACCHYTIAASPEMCASTALRGNKNVAMLSHRHIHLKVIRDEPASFVEVKCTPTLQTEKQLRSAFLYANRFFSGITTLTSFQIELPSVQCAYQVAAFNLAEHRQVCIAVRTTTLHHIIANGDV